MTIKLSKDAENILERQKKLRNDFEELIEASKNLSSEEMNMMGGVILSMYSPLINVGVTGQLGNIIFCDGLQKMIVRSVSGQGDRLKLPEASMGSAISRAMGSKTLRALADKEGLDLLPMLEKLTKKIKDEDKK